MLLLSSPAGAQPLACGRHQSWDAFTRCAFPKRRVEVAQDFGNGKLVRFPDHLRQDIATLGLYVRRDGVWSQTGFHATINASTELLGAQAVAPDTYRVDMGFVSRMAVTIDQISTRAAIIRRRFSYVCPPARSCQQVVSHCELLVNGKMIAGYRGDVVWNGSAFVLRADVRAQNRYCPPPRGVTLEEPDA
jgi:hypothetical protein